MIFDAIASVVGAVTGVASLFGGGGGGSSTTIVNQAPQQAPRPTSLDRGRPLVRLDDTSITETIPETFSDVWDETSQAFVRQVIPAATRVIGRPAGVQYVDWPTTGFVPDPPPVAVEAPPVPFELERRLTRSTALTPVSQAFRATDQPFECCTPCVPACQPGRKPPSRKSDTERLTAALARARNALARAQRCPPVIIQVAPGSRVRRKRR